MAEQKRVVAKKKLALNRETLRSLADNDLQVLDGVVGGTNTGGDTTYCGATRFCESMNVCNTTTC